MKINALLIVVFILVLAGCGTARPTQPPAALDCQLADYVVRDISSDWMRMRLQRMITSAPDSEISSSFNVLSLSAGGQFGAYGAGFLVGWGSVGGTAHPSARQDIQVVTGVSTGSILATHAFLGGKNDEEIEREYRNLSGAQIYTARSPLAYLWANSIYDTSPKDELIRAKLSSDLIDQVASFSGGERFLYIGMVNHDTGEFVRIDMVKLAKNTIPKARRDDCYRAVIGASSAIPIAFSPKFIDGQMWVDGGNRRHVFLTIPPKDAMQPTINRRLYSIFHGDLSVGSTTVVNGVVQIAARSANIFIDQGMKDSIRLQDVLAASCPEKLDCGPTKRLYETSYAGAARAAEQCKLTLTQCESTNSPTDDDLFCRPFMNCLADVGRQDGKDYASRNKPWPTLDQFCLGSDPNCKSKNVMMRALSQ